MPNHPILFYNHATTRPLIPFELYIKTFFRTSKQQPKFTTNPGLIYCIGFNENQFICSLATGGESTFPNITNKDLSNLPCMYPSLSEQHHIAEILTTTDTYIENEQTYLNKLQQKIKQSLWFLFNFALRGYFRYTRSLLQ